MDPKSQSDGLAVWQFHKYLLLLLALVVATHCARFWTRHVAFSAAF